MPQGTRTLSLSAQLIISHQQDKRGMRIIDPTDKGTDENSNARLPPCQKRGTRDRPPLSSGRQKFFSGVTVKTSRRQTFYIAVYSTVFLCILYLLLIVEVVIKGYCANPTKIIY